MVDEIFDFSGKSVPRGIRRLDSPSLLQFDAEGNRLTLAATRKLAGKKITSQQEYTIPKRFKEGFGKMSASDFFGRTYPNIPVASSEEFKSVPTVVQREIYAKSRIGVPPAEYYSMIHPYESPVVSPASGLYLGSDAYIPSESPPSVITQLIPTDTRIEERWHETTPSTWGEVTRRIEPAKTMSKIEKRTGVIIPGVAARKLQRKQFLAERAEQQDTESLLRDSLIFNFDTGRITDEKAELFMPTEPIHPEHTQRVKREWLPNIPDHVTTLIEYDKKPPMAQAEEVGDPVNLFTTEFIKSQPKFRSVLSDNLIFGGRAATSEVAEKLDLPKQAVEMPGVGGLINGMDEAAQARAQSASEEPLRPGERETDADAQTDEAAIISDTIDTKAEGPDAITDALQELPSAGDSVETQVTEVDNIDAYNRFVFDGSDELRDGPRIDIVNKAVFESFIEQNINSETGKITYKPRERRKGDVLVLENLTDVFNPSILRSVDKIQDIKIKGESYVYKDEDGKEHTTPERILSVTEAFEEKIAKETAKEAKKPNEEEVNRVIENSLSIIEGTIDELNQVPEPEINEKYINKETGKWNEYTQNNFPKDDRETDEAYTKRLNKANFELALNFADDQKRQIGTSLGTTTVGRLAVAAAPYSANTSWYALRESMGQHYIKPVKGQFREAGTDARTVTVTFPDGTTRTETVEEYKKESDIGRRAGGEPWTITEGTVPFDEIVRNDPDKTSQFKQAATSILSKIDSQHYKYKDGKLKSRWEQQRWNSIPNQKQTDIIKYLRHVEDGSVGDLPPKQANELYQTYLSTVREPENPQKASIQPDKAKHNYLNHGVFTGIKGSFYNVQKRTVNPEFIKNMSADAFANWKKNNLALADELEKTGEIKTRFEIIPYTNEDWTKLDKDFKETTKRNMWHEFYNENPQYKTDTMLFEELAKKWTEENINEYKRENPNKPITYDINQQASKDAKAKITKEAHLQKLTTKELALSVLHPNADPTKAEVDKTITTELGGLVGIDEKSQKYGAQSIVGTLDVKDVLQDGNVSKEEMDNILQDKGEPETIDIKTDVEKVELSGPEAEQIYEAAKVQAETIGPDFDTPQPEDFLTENGIKGNGDFRTALKEAKQMTGGFTRVTDKAYSGMSGDYLKTLGIDIEEMKEYDKDKKRTTNNTITITDSDDSNIHIEIDDNNDDDEGEEFLKYDKGKLVEHTIDGKNVMTDLDELTNLRLQKEPDKEIDLRQGEWLKESPELKNASPEYIQDIEKIIVYHSNPLRYGKKFMRLPKKDQIEFAKKEVADARRGLFESDAKEAWFTGIPRNLIAGIDSGESLDAKKIYESIPDSDKKTIEKIIVDNREKSEIEIESGNIKWNSEKNFNKKPLKEQIRVALDINKQNLENLKRTDTAYKQKVDKKKHKHVFDGEGVQDAVDKITGGGIVPNGPKPRGNEFTGNGGANGGNGGKKDDDHTDFNSSDSNKKSRDNMAKDRVKHGSSEWLEREIEKLRQAKARNDRVAQANIAKRLAPFTQTKTVMAMNVGGLIKEGVGGSAGLTSTIAATGYRGGRDLIKGVTGAPITAARGISGELIARRAQELELAKLGYPGRGGPGRGGTMESIQTLAKMLDSGQQKSGQFGGGQGLFSERETLAMMGSGQSKLGDMGARATSRGSSLTDFADRIQRSGGSPLTDFSTKVGGTAGHLGGTLAGQMSGQVGGSRGIFTSGKEFLESRGQPTSLRLMGQKDKDIMSFSLGGTLGLGGSMRPEQGLGSPSGFLAGELVPKRPTQNRAPNGRENGAGFRGSNGQ